jgi:hypothetical protein
MGKGTLIFRELNDKCEWWFPCYLTWPVTMGKHPQPYSIGFILFAGEEAGLNERFKIF